MYQPKNYKWFLERIGKRIYRDKLKSCCAHCDKIEEIGLIVHDKLHARYLADTDSDFGFEGIVCNYRDLK